MQTAQIMHRAFLDGFVRSNTKTDMFNLTDFVNQYNAQNADQRYVNNWVRLDSTKKFTDEICRRECKPQKEVLSVKGGRYGGTWGHPLLLLDLAMWLSPEFKYTSLDWLKDNLHLFRDYAGDSFKTMNDACKEHLGYIRPWQYADEANMVNRVLGFQTGQRNLLTEKQLRKLTSVQRVNTKLIERGVVSIGEREHKLREVLDLVS